MRTPQTLPLKGADLTLRKHRTESEARSVLKKIHREHGAVFCVMGIESQSEEVRERFFLLHTQHAEHLAQLLEQEQNPARAFERTLAHINDDARRLGEAYDIRIEKCHVIFGVCAKNQMFLSGFGNLLALFLHKTADRRFSIYELHNQLEACPKNWEKPFTTVLDGEIHPGDVCYVASHIPQSALSPAGLQDILVTLPAKGALERIEGFIPPALPYAGVVLQSEIQTHKQHTEINPMGSLNVLQKTQERTAELLGEVSPGNTSERKTLTAPKMLWMGRKDMGAWLMRAQDFFMQALTWVAQRTKKYTGRSMLFLKERYQKQKMLRARKGKTAKIPLRVMIASSAVLLLITSGAWIGFKAQRTAAENEKMLSENKEEIEKTLSESASMLLYNNTKGAQEKAQEARNILTILQEKEHAGWQETLTLLEESIIAAEEKASGVLRINPTLFTHEKEHIVDGFFLPSISEISESGAVLRFDNTSNSWKETREETNEYTVAFCEEESETSALALTKKNELLRYNEETHTLNPLVSGTNVQKSITGLTTYNNALYVLNPLEQQIIKMRPQSNGYEAGTPWITQRASDITDARALTIDGSIYVLTKSTVRVFFGGKEQSWSMGDLTTPLNNPKDIFTTTESPYLSILDQENARIIIIEKTTGNIIAQYVHDALKNGLRLKEDATTNTLFVLTTNGLLTFTPDHLVK